MTDPLRLSDAGSGATQQELELLDAARPDALSLRERRDMWRELQSLLPAPAPSKPEPNQGPSLGESVAAAGSGVATTGKALLLAIAAAALAGGAYWLTRGADSAGPSSTPSSHTNEARAPAVARTPQASEVSHVDSPPFEPAPPTRASGEVDKRGAQPGARGGALASSLRPLSPRPTTPLAPNDLREESAAVLAARREIQHGDFTSALRQLDDMTRRFPSGSLAQEREALTVEALAGSGARLDAANRARAFLQRYPNSPFAPEMVRHAAR